MKTNFKQFKYNKNDEYQTPPYVIKAIIPFLKEQKIKRILCPADKKDSAFVTIINENTNIEVSYNHIDFENGDFLKRTNENNNFDLIITNPPFSKKIAFIKKANELKIPYMFLLGLPCLNYKGVAEQLEKDKASLIYLVGSKISYDGNPSSFQSAFFTNLTKKTFIILH